MKLHIDDTREIQAIQQEFNSVFPFLKIEFFKYAHETGEASPLGEMLPVTSTIEKWRTIHNEGDITLTKDTTVQEVEKVFQEKFGISAQVFRKSGIVWLETSVTDGWTLSEQNEQGEFMDKDVGE